MNALFPEAELGATEPISEDISAPMGAAMEDPAAIARAKAAQRKREQRQRERDGTDLSQPASHAVTTPVTPRVTDPEKAPLAHMARLMFDVGATPEQVAIAVELHEAEQNETSNDGSVPFNWNNDDDIAIFEQKMTAVYVTPNDYIAIRQYEHKPNNEDKDDDIVLIRPENVPALIERLRAVLQQLKD